MPYRKMKIAVGIFLLTLIIVLSTIIYIVLEKKGAFAQKYQFHFISKTAEAFNVGMPIYYSGFEVGRIVHIELDKKALVDVYFEVNEENRKWICEDSLLLLTKPLIGAAKVEILTSLSYPKLQPNAEVSIVFLDSIDDIISNVKPVLDEVQAIMISVNTITTELAKKDGDLFKTLANFEQVSHKLAQAPSLLNSITGDDESTKLIKASLKETNEAMAQINVMLKTVQNNVLIPSKSSMKSINMILEDVRLKLKSLDGLVDETGAMSDDLKQIKESIELSIESSNQLILKIDSILGGSDNQEVQLP